LSEHIYLAVFTNIATVSSINFNGTHEDGILLENQAMIKLEALKAHNER
jgi:hypothetical protein